MFLIFWLLIMLVMAVFAILCIIFSALSASNSKQYLTTRQYPDYKSAKGKFTPALVFFILTCLTSPGALLLLTAFIELIADGSFSVEDFADPLFFLFFLAGPALFVTATVLGIRCFIWCSRADKLCKHLSAGNAAVPAPVRQFGVCPVCGCTNDAKNNFCVKCGQPLR